MGYGFPPPKLLVLIISLCFVVNSLPFQHVVFTAQPPRSVCVREGQNKTLAWNFTATTACRYKGTKYWVKKRGKWTLLGIEKYGVRTVEPPFKGHIFIEDQGKLKIVNCTSNDTATYKFEVKCSVTNDVPRTVHLTVVVPPKITSCPESDKAVMIGKPLQLSCSASGFPVPNVILYKGGSILAMGCEGSVTWATNSISAEDEGSYKCVAWNYKQIETDERTFRVFVKGFTNNVTNFSKSVTLTGFQVNFNKSVTLTGENTTVIATQKKDFPPSSNNSAKSTHPTIFFVVLGGLLLATGILNS